MLDTWGHLCISNCRGSQGWSAERPPQPLPWQTFMQVLVVYAMLHISDDPFHLHARLIGGRLIRPKNHCTKCRCLYSATFSDAAYLHGIVDSCCPSLPLVLLSFTVSEKAQTYTTPRRAWKSTYGIQNTALNGCSPYQPEPKLRSLQELTGMGNSQTKESRHGSTASHVRPATAHSSSLPSPRHEPGPEGSSADRPSPPVYASRGGRSSRHDLSFLGLGGNNDRDVGSLENRRETKQEREARKLEKERVARLNERERSMREEHVDGGYLVTQGVYVGTEDYNKNIVRQLMVRFCAIKCA